jgi:hypothetical protein
LHLTVPSPSVLAFATFAQARRPQSHTRRFSRGSCNEAARFASCYGPEELLALHRQGRLLSSFHLGESPRPDVEYNYAGTQSIPAAGLTPARPAALWAANEEHEGITSCSLVKEGFLFLDGHLAGIQGICTAWIPARSTRERGVVCGHFFVRSCTQDAWRRGIFGEGITGAEPGCGSAPCFFIG